MNMKMRMSRRLALAGSLLVALAALPVSAFADIGMPCEGAALVIGNGKYQYPAWELSTPRNDAVQIGDALEDLGYSVTRILDADHATLLRGLTDFRHAATGTHFAVIFYSGHASALLGGEGEYLIPVDSIPKDGSAGLYYPQGVSLDIVLWAVQPASRIRLVIMDADHSEPPPISSERLFVAYGGSPGDNTNDGPTMMVDEQMLVPTSPYTTALLRHLRSPGAGSFDLGAMFRLLSIEVAELTGWGTGFGRQIPVVYGTFPHEGVTLFSGFCV